MLINRNLALLYTAAFLRSASIGLLGVVLAVYLSRTGFTATAIGFVLAAGLAGSALATAAVSRYGECFGRRRVLVIAAVLSSLGGLDSLPFIPRPLSSRSPSSACSTAWVQTAARPSPSNKP
jgi:MFS family permease